MWTAGTEFYIKHNLILLNIAQYFDKILSRQHCDESKTRYGKKKSHAYLVSLFPEYKRMRSILIDNFAHRNGSNTGYSEVLSVKPFGLLDVVMIHGAFGVKPQHISDIEKFITSKGNLGVSQQQHKYHHHPFPNHFYYFGDLTLLNTISFLQNRFFKIYYHSSKGKKENLGNNNYGNRYFLMTLMRRSYHLSFVEIEETLTKHYPLLAYSISEQ